MNEKDIKGRDQDFEKCFNCGDTSIRSASNSKKEHYCSNCNVHMDYYKYIDLRVIIFEMMMCINTSFRYYLKEKSFNFRKHIKIALFMLILIEVGLNISNYNQKFVKETNFNLNMKPHPFDDKLPMTFELKTDCTTPNKEQPIICSNPFRMINDHPYLAFTYAKIIMVSILKITITTFVMYLNQHVLMNYKGKTFSLISSLSGLLLAQMVRFSLAIYIIYGLLLEQQTVDYIKYFIFVQQIFCLGSYISAFSMYDKNKQNNLMNFMVALVVLLLAWYANQFVVFQVMGMERNLFYKDAVDPLFEFLIMSKE